MLRQIRHRCPDLLSPEIAAAALLITLGATLRLYVLWGQPPALHQDEVSGAYDVWALLHHGSDRNGYSWPVHFLGWGGAGQNILYPYLSIPFIALGGLSALAYRLPMALASILALFLIWKIGVRAAGRRFALLPLLLLTLSSWHLMSTHWVHEGNLLPLLILLSVYFLSRPDRSRLLIQSLAVFTLSLSVYAYGTAYAFAPLFLALAFLWLLLNRLADWRRLLLLSSLSLLTALPIILFVAVNSFGLDSIQFGPVSIPRYTGPPHYERINVLFHGHWQFFLTSVPPELARLSLGWGGGQSVLPWEGPPPPLPWFGPLPPLTLFLGLFGLALTLYRAKARRDYGLHLLLACWFTAAVIVALTVSIDIHRVNLLWLPALYLIAVGVFPIVRQRPIILCALAAAYLAYGSLFLYQYFGNYPDRTAQFFRSGLGPALQRAVANAGDAAIYITDLPHQPLEPYIHALYYTQTPPQQYLNTRIVTNLNDAFQRNLAYGQFVFTAPWAENREKRLLQSAGVPLDRVAHYVLPVPAAAQLPPDARILEQYGQYYYAWHPTLAAAARGPLLQLDRPPLPELPAAHAPFDIYLEDGALTYYKENCSAHDTRNPFFLHIIPADPADLPPERRQLGFASRDFTFGRQGALYGSNCWATIPLPGYPIARIKTGQFTATAKLWQADLPLPP